MLPMRWSSIALSLSVLFAVGCTGNGQALVELEPQQPAAVTAAEELDSTRGSREPMGTGVTPVRGDTSPETEKSVGYGIEIGTSTGAGAGTDEPAQPSLVSSSISLTDYPWVRAPATVTAFSHGIQLGFSEPVDRASVEERVRAGVWNTNYTLTWSNDQEASLTLKQGCSSINLSMVGARDADGRELQIESNPAFVMRFPCHGTGYEVVDLVDGQPLDGWPGLMGYAVDSDQRGRVLGAVGTIYFVLDNSELRPLAHTESTALARFLPSGDILLSDGSTLRQIDSSGTEVRRVDVPGRILGGAIAPDGSAALLLVQGLGGVDAVRVNLETMSGTTLRRAVLAEVAGRIRLYWQPSANEVLALDRNGWGWAIDLITGQVRRFEQVRWMESPDGRWVIDLDRGGIFAANERDGSARILLTDEMLTEDWAPIWAPDSRYLLMGGGQVIDLEIGSIIRSIQDLARCVPLQPLGLGMVGGGLFVAYQDGCY